MTEEINAVTVHESTAADSPALHETPATSADHAAASVNGAVAVSKDATVQHKSGLWQQFTTIEPSKFIHKSLAALHLNPVVGCFHGCSFCYVPSVSANKQGAKLLPLGVEDPDSEWGSYGFVRIWDEKAFRKSLQKAESTRVADLPDDGHRAVMISTTTDPYQVIKNADPKESKKLTADLHHIVTRSLEIILADSTLNVRILTRGLQAEKHFPLFKKFGKRLMFGVSLPTLNDKLAKVYEPGAPSVKRRLEMLKAAKDAGLHIFVALAPTYPECDEDDLRATLKAIAELGGKDFQGRALTVRAENVARIQAQAAEEKIPLKTEVFASEQAWAQYSIDQMKMAERLAEEVGLKDRLHLWPDAALGKKSIVMAQADPGAFTAWLQRCWSRVSEWAGTPSRVGKEAATAALPAVQAPAVDTKKKSKLTLRTPGEILKMKFDDKDLYLENGVFAKGQPFTLLGPGGLGKSRLLL